MAEAFYPFVDEQGAATSATQAPEQGILPKYPARVAVYDDPLSTPRVVEIAPCEVREYLEQITETTNRLAREQGSHIPFMVIREIVENLIHAYFAQPTVSVLDGGDTITFSDQGPGIANKELARQYGTTSATPEMRRYIRGVGSGLPYVEAWLAEHGGELVIADNIAGGTMVTVTLAPGLTADARAEESVGARRGEPAQDAMATQAPMAPYPAQPAYAPAPYPAYGYPPQGYGYPAQPVYQPQPAYGYPPTYPAQPYPPASVAPQPAASPLDAREQQVVAFLATHAEVGPSDLTGAYGGSNPTWSRVLTTLEGKGLLRKVGQKRQLTDIGRAYLG